MKKPKQIIEDWVNSLTTVEVPPEVKKALAVLATYRKPAKRPAGLPRQPALPEGCTEWVYRGKGWRSPVATHLAFCGKGDRQWDTAFEKAVGYSDFHYMEAI